VAGGRRHTFTILFGVKDRPRAGEAKLSFDLIDTQSRTPPELRIEVNGEVSFARCHAARR
jgi:hypothetical protein